MKRIFSLVFCAITLVIAGCDSPRGLHATNTAATPEKDAVIIDVRTPEEFNRDHVVGAINIPVDTLQTRIEEVVPSKNTPLLVHCQSGRRAQIATEILKAKGYRVRNLGSLANAKQTLQR